MDFNDRVRYLLELLENLVGYVDVGITYDRGSISVPSIIKRDDVIDLAENDYIQIKISGFYNGQWHRYCQTLNLSSGKYFTKGQGKTVANSLKKELAGNLFNF